MRKKLAPFLLIIILFIFALLSSKNIGDFFYPGHEGWLGAQTGIGALNFIQHGFLKLKFCTTLVSLRTQAPSNPSDFYSGHPMLNYYLVAVIWKIFGVSELAGRLYMLLFSIGASIFLFLLVRDLTRSNVAGLFSAAFYLTFPTVQFYGHQINGEISLLFFMIGASWFFYKYLTATDASKQFKPAMIAGIFVFFGCMMDWFSYLFAATFVAIALIWIAIDKKGFKNLFPLILAPLFALLLYILPVIAAKGSLDEIVTKLFFRAGSDSPQYQLISFFNMNISRIGKHFGEIFRGVFILSMLYFLYLPIKLLIFRKKEPGDLFYVILFILPLSFFLLMKQLVDIHDFFMIYFAFFLAFAPTWIFHNLEPLVHFLPDFKSPVLSKGLIKNTLQYLIFVPIIVLAFFYDLRFPFAPSGNINYVHIGNYIQRTTAPGDKILAKIDYPGPNHRDFYARRYVRDDFNPDPNIIENIIGREKGYRLAILENRPDYYNAIIPLLKKYQTTFYRNHFIFDFSRPAGRIMYYKVVPRKSNLFWDYFVSDRRPPEKEILVYDPKIEDAIDMSLGLRSLPTNKFFPGGLSGIYYDNPNFNGKTRSFDGRNDRISYIWVDRIAGDQFGDFRHIIRPWGWFSLILTGKLFIRDSGQYSFYLYSDDYSKFFIDNKLVIESNNKEHKAAQLFLKRGWYDAKLTFADIGGDAALDFNIVPLKLPSK